MDQALRIELREIACAAKQNGWLHFYARITQAIDAYDQRVMEPTREAVERGRQVLPPGDRE
jgi:hypothetical protein